MKSVFIIAIVAVAMIGMVVPNVHAEEIPNWIKQTSGWWADGDVNDDDFINGIGFLIKNGIITLPIIDTTDGISEKNILNLLQDKYPEISFSGIVVPRPIMPVYVTLIDPDGIITKSETYADGEGNYSVIFKFDRSSKTGIYHVNLHHWDKLVKEDSFKLEKISEVTTIPSWIKINAGWWAEGVIDDDSFVSGIEYLVNNRILILGNSNTESSFETEIIIDTNPDLRYGGDFSLTSSSDFPVEVIIKGDLQEKGKIQLSITGMFDTSIPVIYEQNALISDGILKHLFDLDYKFQEGESYTLTATNGNAQTTIEWIPLPSYTNSKIALNSVDFSSDDFRALPGEEKEYDESMNILGKTIRIFDDKICVEEYCKEGNTLPVHMEGNIGVNTKNSIKLQVAHCDKNYYAYCDDYIGLENLIISEIPAKNMDDGNFYADWIFKNTIAEGVYKVESVVDGNVVGEVGESMMDIIDGKYNTFVLVVSNLTPLQITPISDKNAIIFVDIEYATISGTVHYEICAKDDLKNPSFEISSDSAREIIVNEIELKKAECFEGKYTIMAQAPATILVPLGTERSTLSEELDALKSELAELRKMLEEAQQNNSTKK